MFQKMGRRSSVCFTELQLLVWARHVLVLDWRGFPVTRAGAIEVANQSCWCLQHDEGPQCTLSFSATLDAVLSRGPATTSNGFLPSMKGNRRFVFVSSRVA
ncbi:uncharacterized protein LOC144859440 isoform X1 [Branchiostoma floridae x Branchiostoma japonicum]